MSVLVKYKPIGQNMGGMMAQLKKEYPGRRMCFSGRLDVVAHGFVHILFDAEVKLASQYNALSKTYRFSVVIGISTDTTSPLGIITGHGKNGKNSKLLKNTIIAEFEAQIGSQMQKYHNWSSFKYKTEEFGRQCLWWYAANNHLNLIKDRPSKEITIDTMKLVKTRYLSRDTIILTFIEYVELTLKYGNKQYRTEEIYKQWLDINDRPNIAPCEIEYTVLDFECHVSSGTYIRQLVEDISEHLDVPLMTLDIIRIKLDSL